MDSKDEAVGVKNDIKVTKICCEEHRELQKILEEKEVVIRNLDTKLKKIFEDFNYNVQLIYERDREIDILNAKIDELIALNREKDLEIVSLKSLYGKVKQLEHEKYLLNKRIENLLGYEQYPNAVYKKQPMQKLENFTLINEHRPPTHRKHSSYVVKDNNDMIEGRSFYTNSITNRKRNEGNIAPLTKLNLDLENRIRALEQEDSDKNAKHHKRSNTESTQKDFECLLAKEMIVSKEKKIGGLFKSSIPLRPELTFSDKYEDKNSSLSLLSRDLEKLRNEFQSGSRIGLLTESSDETDLIKFDLTARSSSAVNKRLIS